MENCLKRKVENEWASISEVDSDGVTGFLFAILNSDTVCMKEIAKLANAVGKLDELINFPENNGKYPLHVAASYGNDEMLDFLLKSGANVNVRNNEGLTPLDVACRKGNLKTVDVLIKKNANTSQPYGCQPDEKGTTPF